MSNLDEFSIQAFTLIDNWKSLQFWIGVSLGLASVVFSLMAFFEAKKAKKAAMKARVSFSIRNIETELNIEISLLNGINNTISYNDMRKISLELSSKMARINEIIVQQKLVDKTDIQKIDMVINNFNSTLSQVKPDYEDKDMKFQIFNGMSTVITETSQLLSTIVGKIQANYLMEASDDK